MIYIANLTASSLPSWWNADGQCNYGTYSWSSWKSTLGFDTHSIIDIAPDFVNRTTNPDTWDFHLGTQRLGTDLSAWGITTDYDGNTRTNWTMGAFEYGY